MELLSRGSGTARDSYSESSSYSNSSADLESDSSSGSSALFYEYSTLKENHIRLISVHPGSRKSPLVLNLDEVALSDIRDDYAALSYAWEGQAATSRVTVDGKILTITPTVHEALLQLRSEVSTVVLWIDGICIDQTDLQERSAQVQLMRDIYYECASAIVWLGDEDDDTLPVITALGVLANLQRRFDRDGIPKNFDFEGIIERLPMSALRDFLSRPWFSRLCDSTELSLVAWNFIILSDLLLAWRKGHPLSYFLNRSKRRRASDPRDKVYGLLGLLKSPAGITVDYKKTSMEVYTEVARYVFCEEENLQLLSFVKEGNAKDPSWVPNWNEMVGGPHPLGAIKYGHHPYKASLDTTPRISEADGASISEISLQGILVDFLRVHYPYNLSDVTQEDGRHHLEDKISKICGDMALKDEYQYTRESYDNAWMRTIMGDIRPDSRRNQAEHEDRFPIAVRKRELGDKFPKELERKLQQETLNWACQISRHRALFVSEKGYIGIMPNIAREGDFLCMLFGGDMLYILRPTAVAGKYRFIGECYAHGLMDGEGLKDIDLETENFVTFTLV